MKRGRARISTKSTKGTNRSVRSIRTYTSRVYGQQKKKSWYDTSTRCDSSSYPAVPQLDVILLYPVRIIYARTRGLSASTLHTTLWPPLTTKVAERTNERTHARTHARTDRRRTNRETRQEGFPITKTGVRSRTQERGQRSPGRRARGRRSSPHTNGATPWWR